MIVEAVLTHPWDFAFGLLLLIAGPWALRKAGALTLIALSIGVAGAAFTSLTQSGLVASSLLSAVMVYAACVLLAVAAMRHSIVARNGEVLFILALCFLCGRMISSTLNWPEAVVWLLLLLGTIVSPTIPVAVFAAVFLTLTFGVPSATISFAIFAFCLAVAVLQHGGWRRGHIDKSLLAQAHSTPIGALGRNRNSGDQNIEVVIRAESGSQAKQLMR